jgi:hypothetical protein
VKSRLNSAQSNRHQVICFLDALASMLLSVCAFHALEKKILPCYVLLFARRLKVREGIVFPVK